MPQNYATKPNDRRLSVNRTRKCSIKIDNPFPEWMRVELIYGSEVNGVRSISTRALRNGLGVVMMEPRTTKTVEVPGPAKYDVQVTVMEQTGANTWREKRPGSFQVLGHEDLEPEKPGRKTTDPEPEPRPVKIRSMADMFREMEEKEAAAS
jgi:hypothetical protein